MEVRDKYREILKSASTFERIVNAVAFSVLLIHSMNYIEYGTRELRNGPNKSSDTKLTLPDLKPNEAILAGVYIGGGIASQGSGGGMNVHISPNQLPNSEVIKGLLSACTTDKDSLQFCYGMAYNIMKK